MPREVSILADTLFEASTLPLQSFFNADISAFPDATNPAPPAPVATRRRPSTAAELEEVARMLMPIETPSCEYIYACPCGRTYADQHQTSHSCINPADDTGHYTHPPPRCSPPVFRNTRVGKDNSWFGRKDQSRSCSYRYVIQHTPNKYTC